VSKDREMQTISHLRKRMRFWTGKSILVLTIALWGCAPRASEHPEASVLHKVTVTFVEAALLNDSVTLHRIAVDERAMQDAVRLRRLHSTKLVPVRDAVRAPHWVVVHGDTASAVLYLHGDSENEFGVGFLRSNEGWRVIRIGLSPK
jgi:hypothetical protein